MDVIEAAAEKRGSSKTLRKQAKRIATRFADGTVPKSRKPTEVFHHAGQTGS